MTTVTRFVLRRSERQKCSCCTRKCSRVRTLRGPYSLYPVSDFVFRVRSVLLRAIFWLLAGGRLLAAVDELGGLFAVLHNWPWDSVTGVRAITPILYYINMRWGLPRLQCFFAEPPTGPASSCIMSTRFSDPLDDPLRWVLSLELDLISI